MAVVHPFLGTTCALHDSFLHFAPSPRRGSIYGPARYGQIEKERALEAEQGNQGSRPDTPSDPNIRYRRPAAEIAPTVGNLQAGEEVSGVSAAEGGRWTFGRTWSNEQRY